MRQPGVCPKSGCRLARVPQRLHARRQLLQAPPALTEAKQQGQLPDADGTGFQGVG